MVNLNIFKHSHILLFDIVKIRLWSYLVEIDMIVHNNAETITENSHF